MKASGSPPRTIVAAFGGNAVTRATERGTCSEQFANVRVTCEAVLPLLEAGHRLVIILGNGPQVGSLALLTSTTEPACPSLVSLDAHRPVSPRYALRWESARS